MPIRVLLVEDHDDSRIALSRLLEMSDCQVKPAANLAMARSALESGTFDVHVIDLVLPDGSGFELMDESQPWRSTPTIAMSGLDDLQTTTDKSPVSFCDHLRKPVVFNELLSAVRKAATSRPSGPGAVAGQVISSQQSL